MNKNRMTKEEVNEFKPSYYNPMTLVADTYSRSPCLDLIQIISPVHEGTISVIDKKGELSLIPVSYLVSFPSFKFEEEVTTELEEVTMYQSLIKLKSGRFVTGDLHSDSRDALSRQPFIAFEPIGYIKQVVYLKRGAL